MPRRPRIARSLITLVAVAATLAAATVGANEAAAAPSHHTASTKVTSKVAAPARDVPAHKKYLPGPHASAHPSSPTPTRATVARPDTGPPVTVSAAAAHGFYSLSPYINATGTSSAGGTVQVFFYVQWWDSSTWDIANGVEVDVASGSPATWRMPYGTGEAGEGYNWQVQACQSGSCSALTSVAQFGVVNQVGAGDRSYLQQWSAPLSSDSTLHVNEGNGQVAVDWTDLNIASVDGRSLGLTRTYNSWTTPSMTRSDAGQYWTSGIFDVGGKVSTGGIVFVGPSGYMDEFLGSGTTFTAPTGLDADLHVSGSTYTFTFHHDGNGFKAGDVVTLTGTSTLLLQSIKDKHGNAITLAYNPSVAGQVQTVTDAATGRTLTLSNYNAAGQVQTITDSSGRVLTYGYDAAGDLTTFADAGVHAGITGDATTSYVYDTDHDLTQITDPAGRVTTVGYDPYGRVTSVTRGVATTSETQTQFSYGTTNPGTIPTLFELQDPDQDVPSDTRATTQFTEYEHDNYGRVTAVVDNDNNKRKASWNTASNIVTQTDNLDTTPANTTTVGYDTGGKNNPTSIADPTGMTDTLGYGTTFPYQATSQTLPNTASGTPSTKTTYTYNASSSGSAYGDVTNTTQGSTSLSESYQGVNGASCSAKPGETCTTTNGKSGVTSYGYNSHGDLTSVTPPSPLGAIHYTVDSLGRQITSEDGKSQTTTTHYDALDRVTEVDYPASSKTIKYTYDGDGNTTAVAVTTSSGTKNYTMSYDPLNRMTKLTQPANNTLITQQNYSYDLLGNLTQLQQVSGTVYPVALTYTQTYAYDDVNQIKTVNASYAFASGGSGSTAAIGVSHDGNGRTTGLTIGTGETRTISYDNAGREVETKATKVSGAVTLNRPGESGDFLV